MKPEGSLWRESNWESSAALLWLLSRWPHFRKQFLLLWFLLNECNFLVLTLESLVFVIYIWVAKKLPKRSNNRIFCATEKSVTLSWKNRYKWFKTKICKILYKESNYRTTSRKHDTDNNSSAALPVQSWYKAERSVWNNFYCSRIFSGLDPQIIY